MLSPNLPKFDAWWDGGMSIAKTIVKVFHNSKDFTLTQYEGQVEFYNEYLTKYEGYVLIFQGSAQQKNINISKQEVVLNNIMLALKRLASDKRLNFSHLLLAYMQVLYYIDQLNNIHVQGPFSISGTMEPILSMQITPFTTVEEIIRIFDRYHMLYPRLVPFTSQIGAYGFNTFLYLWINETYPVACSPIPYPVHNGLFPGSINTMSHDMSYLRHISLTFYLKGFPSHRVETSKRNFYAIRKIYLNIINNMSQFDNDTLKLLIYFLFEYIHEASEMIYCPPRLRLGPGKQDLGLDSLQGLLRIPEYSPERYGLNRDEVIHWSSSPNGSSVAFKYMLLAFTDANNIICQRYGHDLIIGSSHSSHIET